MTILPTPSVDLASAGGLTQMSGSASMPNMNGNEFMMLLLAQLKNQNPLEPLNDQDLMAQFTQLNSLQELQYISAALQSFASSNQLTGATSLIGKTVEYSSDEGEVQSGVVTGVSMLNDQIMLWLGEECIPLFAVISVNAEEV